jgi:peptidoglycan/LPS O-acetylase OafA/YrhL
VSVDVLMPSCLSALGMGAWLAHLARQTQASRFDLRWLLALGLTGFAACYAWGFPDWLKPVARLGEDCVLGWLVFAVARGLKGPAGRFLEFAPISYLGRISYGIYIIHNFAKPLVDATLTSLNHPDWLEWLHRTSYACIPLFAAITVGLASLSWHLYEKRLNDLKRYFPYPSTK